MASTSVHAAPDTAQVGSPPATPEEESAWLAFLSGMAQSQAGGHRMPTDGFPAGLHPPSHSSGPAAAAAHQLHLPPLPPPPGGLPAVSAAFPPAAPTEHQPGPFPFHLPPIAVASGGGHPSHSPLSHGADGARPPHDVLGRFHNLFHPPGASQAGGSPHQSSAHSSSLPSPHIAPSEPSSALSSPHLGMHSLAPPDHQPGPNQLSSFFSSFFPPPEPSHFGGPASGGANAPHAHGPSQPHQPPSEAHRRPSSSFSFSPTSFSNLHLPDLLDIASGPHPGGALSGAHLPPLHHHHDPLAPPPLPPLSVSPRQRPDPLAPPSLGSLPARADPGSVGRSSVGSPVTPIVALAGSSSSATTPVDHDPSPGKPSSSSGAPRGRKRTLPASSTSTGRTTRNPSVSATDDDGPGAARASGLVAPATADSPSEVANREAVEDDKRRRNTEASARFRAKKKNHTVNLTRTVSDLTSRVGELEVEAGDLRRENTWLKEIVVARARGQTVDGSGAGPSGSGGAGGGLAPPGSK